MLAGFSLGLAVASVGEPRRLARQLFGLSEGLFGPIFFVWLGATLDLRDLRQHAWMIALGVALAAGALVAHAAAVALRQPLAVASLATAQLGLPVAATTLGTQLHVLRPGEGAALLLGALLTVAVAGVSGRQIGTAPSEAQRQSR
jgi:Kef-type K+ transport system membrane component KefB